MPQPAERGCLTRLFTLCIHPYKIHPRTSAFNTSSVLSFEAGPMRSISALLLSALHTDTRLFVTLCTADWTRHGPTLNGGG